MGDVCAAVYASSFVSNVNWKAVKLAGVLVVTVERESMWALQG